MIPLRLDEVAALAEGRLTTAPSADEITGVKVDSRRIEAGDLFVAIGRGVDHLDDALAGGAAATLVPNEPFAAMAALGHAVRGRSSARVVGITGSTGKTSTKDILAALCAPAAVTVAAEASYNNEIGVPLTLCRLEPETEVCILELAMRGFGQIAELCEIARPEIGIVTNVGPAHLELVGSLEGVLRAKSELVAALPQGGTAIVPEEFPVDREDIEVVRLAEPEVAFANGRASVGGVSFNVSSRHQAANASAALAALDALGLPRPAGVDVDFSRWRGEELELPGGGLLINDAYNANPISMRAALDYLSERAGSRRRVVVLGDMAELGPGAPEFHRQVGEEAGRTGVEVLVAVGELARSYLDGATGVPVTRWVADASAAVQAADEVVEPGDCVLVKASRAVGLEVVAEALAAVRA
ncbi:MAG: UDP-N-acetylmuramoyl-tripeptide--D-alanyl-D-alanine ligase [Actinobacteria bacterium]|nr:MAG: UDP-N-acetylmuramoyl-tripeptide--D-alanyl-D-alanine ligase [Actinomycetota bacterium]